MKIEISHKYSNLDRELQFGLVIEGTNEIYIRWVYFYMGKYWNSEALHPYPFHVNKVKKRYKGCNDAERQAKMIVVYINKIIEHLNKQLTQ